MIFKGFVGFIFDKLSLKAKSSTGALERAVFHGAAIWGQGEC